MVRKEDKLRLELQGMITPAQSSSLLVLYAPLMGKDAVLLYESMLAIAALPQKVKNHLLVSKLCGLSMERLEEMREVLEQYLLLKTYYDAIHNAYIYELHMPKLGNDFLSHDVFGRLYMKQMGKQVYEFARKSYAPIIEDKSMYQDISVSMRSLMYDWNEKEEDSFHTMRPEKSNVISYAFNFDTFLHGLSDMIFPKSQRTKENLSFIAEKAGIYGITEKDMQLYVGKSINMKTSVLDRNKLLRFMQANKKDFEKAVKDPYKLPPVRFLQMKQQGVQVSSADQRLIDTILTEKYHLVPEVINALLEYVLERCNQVLSKSYVEKVASTWVRLHVDTLQKAQEVIASEGKETKTYKNPAQKQLPKWFHDQDSVKKASKEIKDEELLEKMKKLGES